MLVSDSSSSLEYSNYSAHCQDFKMSQPAKKAKLRSIVPTPSSLLTGIFGPDQVTKFYKHPISHVEGPTPEYKMEEYLVNRSGENEISEELSSDFHPSLTEDILMREDENGTRSHICPLDSELYGIKDGDKDHLNLPVPLDSCSLSSEEAPYAFAVKPSSSNSEDSDNSSIEGDTSINYEPIENQSNQSKSYNTYFSPPLRIPRLFQKNETTTQDRRLDQKTMDAWEDDSDSEIGSYDKYIKDSELLIKNTPGNESDMEEFEEDPEEESGVRQGINNQDENQNKKENGKEVRKDDLGNNLDCINEDGKSEPTLNSNTKDINENRENKNENDLENHANTKKLRCANDEPNEKCVPEFHVSSNKTGENVRDALDDSFTKIETGMTTEVESEEKKANLTREPVEMNISKSIKEGETQRDYGEILYSETLIQKQIVDKMLDNETKFDGSENKDGLMLTDIPILKSATKSDIFEPVLPEEKKVASKPRNKLVQFFQSFKKKFEKTRKA